MEHPNKHVREAVKYAQGKGWRLLKADRALTFGDSYFVPTRVEAAASFGFSVRQETRRTMRAESVRKSMIVLTPETTATKEG